MREESLTSYDSFSILSCCVSFRHLCHCKQDVNYIISHIILIHEDAKVSIYLINCVDFIEIPCLC